MTNIDIRDLETILEYLSYEKIKISWFQGAPDEKIVQDLFDKLIDEQIVELKDDEYRIKID